MIWIESYLNASHKLSLISIWASFFVWLLLADGTNCYANKVLVRTHSRAGESVLCQGGGEDKVAGLVILNQEISTMQHT